MKLILLTAAISALVFAVLTLPFPLVRRTRQAWRRYLWLNLALLPVDFLVVTPAMLGFAGMSFLGTRPDERGYTGPRLAENGEWIAQSRESLGAERASGTFAPPTVEPTMLVAADGVPLRTFFVPTHRTRLRVSAVLVHGLFRGALELEPVGAMLRELGVDVLLLELRNHGGSGRAAPSFGLRESQDVIAAAHWLRQQKRTRDDHLVLFAVSLGTIAASLAAPQIEELAGIAFDAPVLDPLETAHAMLGDESHPRRPAFPEPFRSLSLTALQLWCGFWFDEIRVRDALLELPRDLPVLVVGGGLDTRVPPANVHAFANNLGDAEVRIVPDAGHGTAFVEHGDHYMRWLAEWLVRVRN